MRDHEDLSALEALILVLLFDDDTRGEDVAVKGADTQAPPVDTPDSHRRG